MRAYADTSFLVRLLTQESGSADAIADYRRLGRPAVFFLPLHGLEITNALRQRAFHQRHSVPSAERAGVALQRDAALARLNQFLARKAFIESAVDLDKAIEVASALSTKHTERLGCLGFDLLHVALALELECESFLTSDRVQGALARAEGLDVTVSAGE
jgi:predicted nucleic acid-binding protein